MPAISVILPVYNAEHTIRRAVQSILDQTFRDIELIVLDDGSTDRTVHAISDIADARLRVESRQHQGVAAAANAALKISRASIVARMDADDIAWPDRLQQQLHLLDQKHLDAVGCGVRIVDANGVAVESMQRYEQWINKETLTHQEITGFRFVEFPLVNPTILARRRYFELLNRTTDLPEDYDLLLRAAGQGMRFGKVPVVMLDWTDGPDRLTRTDPRYTNTAFDRCRKLHLLQGPLQQIRVVDLWGAGQTGKPWLRWLQSGGFEVRRIFEVNRRKTGKLIHGVPVLHYTDVSDCDGTPLIVAVGAKGARRQIQDWISPSGYVAGVNVWFVA